MPSRYRVRDPTYDPPDGTLAERVHEEIRDNNDEHSSRTLADRLFDDPTPADLRDVVDALELLQEEGAIGAEWVPMEAYVEHVTDSDDHSVTREEILEGSKLSLEHAEMYGRSTEGVEAEIDLLES